MRIEARAGGIQVGLLVKLSGKGGSDGGGEVEVGKGSNVGRSFDQNRHQRRRKANANITATGRLYRAATRYALHATHLTQLLR